MIRSERASKSVCVVCCSVFPVHKNNFVSLCVVVWVMLRNDFSESEPKEGEERKESEHRAQVRGGEAAGERRGQHAGDRSRSI